MLLPLLFLHILGVTNIFHLPCKLHSSLCFWGNFTLLHHHLRSFIILLLLLLIMTLSVVLLQHFLLKILHFLLKILHHSIFLTTFLQSILLLHLLHQFLPLLMISVPNYKLTHCFLLGNLLIYIMMILFLQI